MGRSGVDLSGRYWPAELKFANFRASLGRIALKSPTAAPASELCRSSNPPAVRLTNTCAMITSSQRALMKKFNHGLSICARGKASDGMDRMFVADVSVNSSNLFRIPKPESVVDVNRRDRRVLRDEQFLRLLQQLRARFHISEAVGAAHQVVVFCALPAGAIVRVVAHEHVEKRVWIVVIADPTAADQIIFELALEAKPDFVFDATQTDIDVQCALPHVLQFDGNFFVVARAAERVFNARKSLAVWKAGFGEQLPCFFRVESETFGR